MRHLLLFLSLLLPALPTAGQALGLGELIYLRRVSQKKAARLLTRQGWQLESASPEGPQGYSTQTWVPVNNGTADSTSMYLHYFRSWWRRDYLIYGRGDYIIGNPARMKMLKTYKKGEVVRRQQALFYPVPFGGSRGRSLRQRHLLEVESRTGKLRSGGAAFSSSYYGAFPWVKIEVEGESGTPYDCHCTRYYVRSTANPLPVVGMWLAGHLAKD